MLKLDILQHFSDTRYLFTVFTKFTIFITEFINIYKHNSVIKIRNNKIAIYARAAIECLVTKHPLKLPQRVALSQCNDLGVFTWMKFVLGRRVTLLPDLPWVIQFCIHFTSPRVVGSPYGNGHPVPEVKEKNKGYACANHPTKYKQNAARCGRVEGLLRAVR